jgi:hypothetical protein
MAADTIGHRRALIRKRRAVPVCSSSPSARRDRFPRQGDPPLAMGPGSAMLVPGLDEHARSSAEGLECVSPNAAGAGGDRWIETMDTRRGP